MVQAALFGLQALGWARRNGRLIAGAVLGFALVAGALYLAHRVDQHFDRVTATERDLTEAETAARQAKVDLDRLGRELDQNARSFERERLELREARRVAEAERDAAVARAERYRQVREAALSAPPEDRSPVSPVVRDTVDRLWPVG